MSSAPAEDPRLGPGRNSVYALGDFTVNTALTSLSMVYVGFFLVQVAGLRPELAVTVQLVGRLVDAFTDPAMGRISDRIRWRWGRRRPFFLMAALPFGASFALLWWDVPLESQGASFAYYTSVYVAMSLSMTVLSVPYLALQPEMARGYDARTSLNTYRNIGSIFGVFAAIAIRPVAEALGGDEAAGFARAGIAFGVMLAVPWLAVWCATWERPEFQVRPASASVLESARALSQNRSFRRLTGLYLCGRTSMDLVGAMLILYFTFWIGRSSDFELTMLIFLTTVVLVLPIWLRISRSTEKTTVFIIGSVWWMVCQGLILATQPDWPRWILFVFVPLAAIGYAVVDLIPWAMLGEVVDEDDLEHGERREGLYNGVFMFVRKLAGSAAVWLAFVFLGWLGYQKGDTQNEATVAAIRWMTSIGPACFLALGILFARGYPLTRQRHAEIVTALAARDASASDAPPRR
jgi:sugar (glycoside-pentoside-hexuronide) transporter